MCEKDPKNATFVICEKMGVNVLISGRVDADKIAPNMTRSLIVAQLIRNNGAMSPIVDDLRGYCDTQSKVFSELVCSAPINMNEANIGRCECRMTKTLSAL